MKKQITIVYNPHKKNFKEALRFLKQKLAKEYKIKIVASNKLNESVCLGELVVCVGGDGTILKVGNYAIIRKIPVLGINLGGLGYLAEFEPNEAVVQIRDYFNGKTVPQERIVLEVVYRNKIYYAINDCVVKHTSSKVCNIEIKIENEIITQMIGDGIIIATPTGSTAYSLACGGSIIEPSAEVLLLTPISPHTLSIRPIVIPSCKSIELRIPEYKSNKDLILSLDGQRNFNLEIEDTIKIFSSEKKLLFLPNKKKTFFKILTQKLSWGKR